MGFGHRVYKNYDPRAKIIKRMADEVFEVTGRNPLLDIALELERIALEDEYFVKRKLYPNVDFYSGLIYQAMGFPVDMFPVLFAIPRTSGWLAQWEEMLEDKEQKIARPRQIYLGAGRRDYVPLAARADQGRRGPMPRVRISRRPRSARGLRHCPAAGLLQGRDQGREGRGERLHADRRRRQHRPLGRGRTGWWWWTTSSRPSCPRSRRPSRA